MNTSAARIGRVSIKPGVRGRARVLAAGAVLVAMGALAGCMTTSTVTDSRLSSDEKAAQANLNLGAAYLREGRPQLALDKLQRALDQNPRLAEAHSAIALAYERLGQPDEAEKHYRRASQLAPDNPDVANNYAVFLCGRNRWRAAEPYFERAANNPHYSTPAAALSNAGTCARSAGQLDRAESYYRAALEKDKAFPDALAGLMELAYQQQNYLEARAFLQRYLGVQSASAPALWLCFNIERHLGDATAAQRCATRLGQDFPASAEFAELRRFERDARQ